METVIQLTPVERMICGFVGLSRNAAAWAGGMQLEPGRRDLGIERHVVGAMGEFAVARALGINWNPVFGETDTQRGDVGPYQVKAITEPGKNLLVRKQDPTDMIYILSLVTMRAVTLLGWVRGDAAKVDRYWTTPKSNPKLHHPCFVFPQFQLTPMSELPRRNDRP